MLKNSKPYSWYQLISTKSFYFHLIHSHGKIIGSEEIANIKIAMPWNCLFAWPTRLQAYKPFYINKVSEWWTFVTIDCIISYQSSAELIYQSMDWSIGEHYIDPLPYITLMILFNYNQLWLQLLIIFYILIDNLQKITLEFSWEKRLHSQNRFFFLGYIFMMNILGMCTLHALHSFTSRAIHKITFESIIIGYLLMHTSSTSLL